jgi:hypothetical protein
MNYLVKYVGELHLPELLIFLSDLSQADKLNQNDSIFM